MPLHSSLDPVNNKVDTFSPTNGVVNMYIFNSQKCLSRHMILKIFPCAF